MMTGEVERTGDVQRTGDLEPENWLLLLALLLLTLGGLIKLSGISVLICQR